MYFAVLWMILLPALLAADTDRLARESKKNTEILILHSYSQSFSWTETINRGLIEGSSDRDYSLWFEYMDAKRFNSPEYLEQLYDMFSYKFSGAEFDLVVTSDNLAYEFFMDHRSSLFNNAPALSIGLNEQPGVRAENVRYIIERNDYRKNIDLALTAHPDARNIHIIIDQTLTGSIIREQLEDLSGEYTQEFNWIDSGDLEELTRKIKAVHPRDVIVYVLYFYDGEKPVNNDRILNRLASVSPVPIYSFWSFAIPEGALGGYVYDGYLLGRFSSHVLESIWQNGEPDQWQGLVNQPMAGYQVDFPTARRYGLDKQDFPRDTLFLREPEGFFQKHARVLGVSSVIILVLVLLIILIQINLQRHKALNRYNSAMVKTQKEVMHNLSIVIERRSSETAEHLNRITGLSTFIAQHLGLSQDQIDSLHLGASLHDVGKVGISDTILKKAGPLTPPEMAEIRTHPRKGYEILKDSENEYIRTAAIIALEHHECWDGSGYPDGKQGEEIHILARIVTMCDVVDALLSERSYKPAWSTIRVRDYVLEQNGKLFDPAIAEFVLANWQEFLSIWEAGGDKVSLKHAVQALD
ncbi:Response regulator [Salinispira pacifica]|uniref:Response regulator n=2 Tax=Salinispira pacifica TaxID=1307761 RepID=V5WE43_9SPIO|nr:Response regulator [Salinispira pacifica]